MSSQFPAVGHSCSQFPTSINEISGNNFQSQILALSHCSHLETNQEQAPASTSGSGERVCMWFPSWFWLSLTGTQLKCAVTYINQVITNSFSLRKKKLTTDPQSPDPGLCKMQESNVSQGLPNLILGPLPGGRDHCDPHFPEKETEAQRIEVIQLMCSNAWTATFPQAPLDPPHQG